MCGEFTGDLRLYAKAALEAFGLVEGSNSKPDKFVVERASVDSGEILCPKTLASKARQNLTFFFGRRAAARAELDLRKTHDPR